MSKPLMLISGEGEDGAVSARFLKVLKEVMRNEGVKAEILVHTSQTATLTLVFGKPKDSFLQSQSKDGGLEYTCPMINGPSEKTVFGTPKGLENLRRAVLLWKMAVEGKLTAAHYEYLLAVPKTGEWPEEGTVPAVMVIGEIVRSALAGHRLEVDIEVSGDVDEDEPEDAELLSVGIYWVDENNGYHNRVWTKEALHDPGARDALAAVLTCGVKLSAHYAQFDFKYINNHLEHELHNASVRRKAWGEMFARTPGKIYPTHDTMLMHYCMYPGSTGEHGLKDLSQTLLGAPEWEKEIKKYLKGKKGNYERIPPNLLYSYNAGDVYWTDKLATKLLAWIEDSPPAKHLYYDTLMPMSRMYIDLEATVNGWPMNEKLGRKQQKVLTKEAAKLLAEFREQVGNPLPFLGVGSKQAIMRVHMWRAKESGLDPASIRQLYLDRHWLTQEQVDKVSTPTRQPVHDETKYPFLASSPDQVKAWLWAHGHRVRSTDKDTQAELLAQLSDELKVIDTAPLSKSDRERRRSQVLEVKRFLEMLGEYRHTEKMLSVYVSKPLQHMRGGKSRSRHKINGTMFGRLSGAMTHTVPRIGPDGWTDRVYREMYWAGPPKENMRIIGCDFGQVETRVVAELINSPQMIADLQEGQIDFFSLLLPGAFPSVFKNIGKVMDMKAKDKRTWGHYRQQMKPVSHGANYLRQAPAIAEQLQIPEAQAQRMFDSYFERYPELIPWQNETMDYVEGLKIDPIWNLPGLYTMFGRRFHVGVINSRNRDEIHRSAVSFKPQSIGSDLTQHAMLRLHNDGELAALGGRLVGSIHDAAYALGPADKAEEIRQLMMLRMRESGAAVFSRVPFTVDGKIGTDWADVDSPRADLTPRKKAKAT